MDISDSILSVFTSPTPAHLRRLRGDLLEVGVSETSAVWPVLDKFHEFLNQLYASMSAHEYSKLATLLDIGAVGGVAFENVLQSGLDKADIWKKLLVGGASEALMVVASRQYVKAFMAETSSVFANAAWSLHRLLWLLSLDTQRDLSPKERRTAIDHILAPVQQDGVNDQLKAVLIGRLFLVVLLLHLSEALQQSEPNENVQDGENV